MRARGAGSSRCTLSPRIRRDLAVVHGEDQLPVALGGGFGVDIAVGQRVAVQRALMDYWHVAHARALREDRARFGDHVWRRVVVGLGEAAVAAFAGGVWHSTSHGEAFRAAATIMGWSTTATD